MDTIPSRLAVVNFAQTVDEMSSEVMKGFLFITPAVYRQAASIEGHIASARPCDDREDLSFFERDWGIWGNFTVPNYYVGGRTTGKIYEASALSLWNDIGAVYRFVYSGVHRRAIQGRKSWFKHMSLPNYAMWWTSDWPTWLEGAHRLEKQISNGDTPESFTFRNLFDERGNPLSLQDVKHTFV